MKQAKVDSITIMELQSKLQSSEMSATVRYSLLAWNSLELWNIICVHVENKWVNRISTAFSQKSWSVKISKRSERL